MSFFLADCTAKARRASYFIRNTFLMYICRTSPVPSRVGGF